MEDFLAQAKDQGLYCVNNEDPSGILEEYEDVIRKAEKLCSEIDPVETPYKSKYEARALIDNIVNKLDANKTIASLEKNRKLMDQMSWRLASLRVKLGSISWDVEEPHNAQTELELALEYYFPQLASIINATLFEEDDSDKLANYQSCNMLDYCAAVQEALVSSNTCITMDGAQHTTIIYLQECRIELCLDVLKCINLLGILWAGRMHIKRAFCYLLSAQQLYTYLKQKNTSIMSIDKSYLDMKSMKTIWVELDSVYTHILFYLAQAYGHIGNSKQASLYCYHTLHRQHMDGLTKNHEIVEWCVNCAGLCEFFIAIQNYKQAAYVLLCAEKVLLTYEANGTPELQEKYVELQANLHRKYIKLDMTVFKIAAQHVEFWEGYRNQCIGRIQTQAKDAAASAGVPVSVPVSSTNILPPAPPDTASTSTTTSASSANPAAVTGILTDFVPFHRLEITPLALITNTIDDYTRIVEVKEEMNICCYEDARAMFLRIQSRIEAAKKHYIMDGYVTDHINLLLDHSSLFQLLTTVDPDVKRKLAMQLRRADLISPLLGTISRTAYEDLQKQISYECGEIYMSCVDYKLEKCLQKLKSGSGAFSMADVTVLDLPIQLLKPNDITLINEYITKACKYFNYFTCFYITRDGETSAADQNQWKSIQNLTGLQLNPSNMSNTANTFMSFLLNCTDVSVIAKSFNESPDLKLLSKEELRPYFNCYLYTSRLLSKIIDMNSINNSKLPVAFIVESLNKYNYLSKTIPTICAAKGVSLEDIHFEEEWKIIQEMIKLLPSKLDMVCKNNR